MIKNIGAGSGLSASAGYEFAGERLKKHFGDFVNKYGMTDMYTGCFADFETNEERWACWSRRTWINRYEEIPKDTHRKLLELLAGKDYFILTTNIDHTFQRSDILSGTWPQRIRMPFMQALTSPIPAIPHY